MYEFLRTRLRAKKRLNAVPCVRSTSNPGDIGHGWVKKRFVEDGVTVLPRVDAAPAPGFPAFPAFAVGMPRGMGEAAPEDASAPEELPSAVRPLTVEYIPARVTDNPHIGTDYIRQLQNKPEALRKAYLLGDWNAFEGQVFTEWADDPAHYADRRFTHVVQPFAIPLHWPRFMSFDHGYTRPFSVGWWAVAPDGTAYRYREWYGCEPGRPNTGIRLTPRQIAEGILLR